MTHVITFDTLAYANKLKEAGMDTKLAETQAQVQAELLTKLVDDQLATKQDFKDLQIATKQDFENLHKDMNGQLKDLRKDMDGNLKGLRSDMDSQLKEMRTEMRSQAIEIEHRLLFKLGSIMVISISALATLMTLLHIH